MKTKKTPVSRRKFIEASSAIAAGLLLFPKPILGAPAIIKNYNKPNSVIKGVQIGVITYSFRSMPDQSAEATLKYITDSGISAVELMGEPAESFAGMPQSTIDRETYYRLRGKQKSAGGLTEDEKKEFAEMKKQISAHNKAAAKWRATASMDKFEQFKKMYKDAGVSIYGFKPRAFGKNNTDAEIDFGMRAAKALGASHVTLEHPSDDAHTLKLGTMAKKHKIRVAYHGHEQQNPTFWNTALSQSKYNAINLDSGHYVAAGYDPIEFIKKNHSNIYSMHMKDRQNKANGKKNLVWGTGDTPIPQLLKVMSEQKYKFPGTIELEYQIPEGSDAVKEVGKCLEFCRESLA
ncbi:TIM barrel protein [Flammeovirgaceae bacterium SG7u.111]|nr:TIM barrel protein [Flammeovirgaceae bacterium SG7u.132]WPO37039.1 TIM barrel protein [Flammeovirgaceae bacterium SG7u.111]